MPNSEQNAIGPSGTDTPESDSPAAPARHKRAAVGASYRKRRTIVACEVCRARRTKCDGKRPICSFCKDNGGNCTYQSIREPPPNRLETELSAVRERLDGIQSLLAQAPVFAPPAAAVSFERINAQPNPRIPIMTLSDCGFMKVLGLQENVAEEVIAFERAHSVEGGHGRGMCTLVIQQPQVLRALEAYHGTIHIWFPFLHPSFKDHFLSIVLAPIHPSSESCLALMVIAIGCVAQSDPFSYLSLPNPDYATAALEMLPKVLTECSIVSVQSLIAIALYYNTLLKPIQAHDYIMIASLRIQTLMKMKPSGRNPDGLELLHRAYWTILLIEAELANPFDLPSSGISKLNDDIPLPSSARLYPSNINITSPVASSILPAPAARTSRAAALEEISDFAHSAGYSPNNFAFALPLQAQHLGGNHDAQFPRTQTTRATLEQVEAYFLAEIAMRRMLFRCTSSTRFQEPNREPTYAPIVAAELAYQLDEWYHHLPACLRFDRFTTTSSSHNSNSTAFSSPHIEFLRTQFYSCRAGIYWPAAYEAIRDWESTRDGVDPAVDMFIDSYSNFIKSAASSVQLCQPNQWIIYAAIFPMTLAAHRTMSVSHLQIHAPGNLEHCFQLAREAFRRIAAQSVSLDYLAELLNKTLGDAEDNEGTACTRKFGLASS